MSLTEQALREMVAELTRCAVSIHRRRQRAEATIADAESELRDISSIHSNLVFVRDEFVLPVLVKLQAEREAKEKT